MDCNKDDASRAKLLAEKKFREQDLAGAKKFALKAQNLYPDLNGIAQLLATLDVHICAEKKENEVVDWYKVLDVEPSADEDTIQSHYRRLAVFLHPNNNKSVGADGAFKLLCEAWNLLSDKAKRTAYDQKRNLRSIDPNVPYGRPSSSVPVSQNGLCSFGSNAYSNTRDHRGGTPPLSSQHPHPPAKSSTFWTSCSACKLHFEYPERYRNANLRCPHCRHTFIAMETPVPQMNRRDPPTLWNSLQPQNASQYARTEGSYAPGRIPSRWSRVNMSDVFPKSVNAGGTSVQASSPAQAADVAQTAYEELKRRWEEAFAAMDTFQKTQSSTETGSGLSTGSFNAGSRSVKGDRPKNMRRMDKHRMNNNGTEMAKQVIGGVDLSESQRGLFETAKVNINRNLRRSNMMELRRVEVDNMLIAKAKKTIAQKLTGCSLGDVLKTSNEEIRKKEKGKTTHAENDETNNASKSAEDMDIKPSIEIKKFSLAISDVDPGTKATHPLTMSVPDPDFHDFDKDRTEKSFCENQVWAAYDDDDGMPRYYAMIHRVESLRPFRMRVCWLGSKSNDELAPINWIGSGFYKTSGDFRRGKYEVNKSLNSFSHKVKWMKGSKGVIQIYPREGDVWSLYRNWSPEWNELTPDEVRKKYDMVEVIADYSEERGVAIVPLEKVAGFKTVFRRHVNPDKIRIIPREEMFRFSHQVPSYFLTGQEGLNAPRGCLELDPAAMPLELLQVLTEAELSEMEGATERAKQDIAIGDVRKSREDELVENGKATDEKNIAETEEKAVDVVDEMIVYKRRRLGKQKSSG